MVREKFNIKDFIDQLESKDFRKSSTVERAEIIWSESRRVAMWHINNSFRERKLREELCDVLHDKKILKSIARVIKESNGDDTGFPAIFAVVLRDVIDTQRRKLGSDELLDAYEILIYKILKRESDELSKATGISKELSYELLTVLPSPEIINRKQIIGIYVGRINRKLYIAEDHQFDQIKRIKTIRQIYKYLFGNLEDVGEISLSILLERRPSNDNAKTNVYSLLTVFALDSLENTDKTELRELIQRYGERRKREREGQRRIILSEIEKDDYPRITKAVNKVIKKQPELGEFL